MAKTLFTVDAHWDAEADVWWSSCDQAPLTTEARTFEELVARVNAIAPEIIVLNHLAKPGDGIEIVMRADRSTELVLPDA